MHRPFSKRILSPRNVAVRFRSGAQCDGAGKVVETLDSRDNDWQPWSFIQEHEVFDAQAAFLLDHGECVEKVEVLRGEFTIVCWCGACNAIKAYPLVGKS